MSKVGFIGMGIMGRPMSLNLIRGGHELYVHSRHGAPQELLAAGATACDSGMEVASKADTIITTVPDTPDVAAVLFGAKGVAEGLTRGKIVVDMSSISPAVEPSSSRRRSTRSVANSSTHRCRAVKSEQRQRA
jgi:2-hydroxy-3-oxopropionate reductase